MNSGDFVIYEIDPNEMEQAGEVYLDKNVNGRLFLHSTIEINGSVLIFRNTDNQQIRGVFSTKKYYVLRYDNR